MGRGCSTVVMQDAQGSVTAGRCQNDERGGSGGGGRGGAGVERPDQTAGCNGLATPDVKKHGPVRGIARSWAILPPSLPQPTMVILSA